MRAIYWAILIFGFALLGCQDKKDNNFVSDSLKEVVAPQTAQPAPRAKTSTNHTKYGQTGHQSITPINAPKVPPIGIKVDQNQIIIDTNQTKKFLESLTKKLDQSFKKVAEDLRNNQVRSPNDTGIVITQDRIEVDLNKTQKFMEKWIKSVETIGKQLDSVAKELDKSFNP